MGKYDFDLDLTYQNSLLLILEQVKPETSILEFGPANGRLTRYLKKELNCRVYLIELDLEAGKNALEFGEDLVTGDIEAYEWLERYKDIKFDYLIFADILEHLRSPAEVLIKAKLLLKENGSVLLSVPNFAHNAVLINLLNNEFEYNSTGLLDNTHIHMFTKNSLEKMLKCSGMYPIKRMATYMDTEFTEVAASLKGVQGIEAEYWKNRPYGEVYQYVYEVKKGRELCGETLNYLKAITSGFYLQVFGLNGRGYEENYSCKKNIVYPLGQQLFEIEGMEISQEVRIDPMDVSGVVRLINCEGIGDQGNIPLTLKEHNAKKKINNLYYFETDDPQWIFNVPMSVKKLCLQVEYVCFEKVGILSQIFCAIETWEGAINDQVRQLKEQNTEINKYNEENILLFQNANKEIERILEKQSVYKNKVEELEKKNRDLLEINKKYKEKISEQQTVIDDLKAESNTLLIKQEEMTQQITALKEEMIKLDTLMKKMDADKAENQGGKWACFFGKKN